jgi:hypothetical protein
MIANLKEAYKKKLHLEGFNVLAVRWIHGRKKICLTACWDSDNKKIVGRINCVDEGTDDYNGILQTVSYGSPLSLLETVGFFPNIEMIKEYWKKTFPKYFT